jgi:hypothetical protein
MMTVEPCMGWRVENANSVTNTAALQLIVRPWSKMDHGTIIEQMGYVHNNLSDLNNSSLNFRQKLQLKDGFKFEFEAYCNSLRFFISSLSRHNVHKKLSKCFRVVMVFTQLVHTDD